MTSPIPVTVSGWVHLEKKREPHLIAIGTIILFERFRIRQCKLFRRDQTYWTQTPEDTGWATRKIAHDFDKHLVRLLHEANPEIFAEHPPAPTLPVRAKGPPWPSVREKVRRELRGR
jgi:hypothetical protein